jgi:hypothetical protein
VPVVFVKLIISIELDQQNEAMSCLTRIAEHVSHADDRDLAFELLLGAADRSFRTGHLQILKTILGKVVESSKFLTPQDAEFWRPTLLIILRYLYRT